MLISFQRGHNPRRCGKRRKSGNFNFKAKSLKRERVD